jgi:hypothetical protein
MLSIQQDAMLAVVIASAFFLPDFAQDIRPLQLAQRSAARLRVDIAPPRLSVSPLENRSIDPNRLRVDALDVERADSGPLSLDRPEFRTIDPGPATLGIDDPGAIDPGRLLPNDRESATSNRLARPEPSTASDSAPLRHSVLYWGSGASSEFSRGAAPSTIKPRTSRSAVGSLRHPLGW